MIRLLCALLIIAILGGCTSATGKQISQSAAMQFKEGQSTESEILSRLGSPTSTSIVNNKKVLVYSGGQAQVKGATYIPIVGMFAGGSDYQASVAIFSIGSNGVLEKITYSTSNSGTRLGSTPADMSTHEPSAIK